MGFVGIVNVVVAVAGVGAACKAALSCHDGE